MGRSHPSNCYLFYTKKQFSGSQRYKYVSNKFLVLKSFINQLNHNNSCWVNDGVYNYLLTGPVCMSLLVSNWRHFYYLLCDICLNVDETTQSQLNLFFLINIVRVLVTKLRAVNTSDTHQTRYSDIYYIYYSFHSYHCFGHKSIINQNIIFMTQTLSEEKFNYSDCYKANNLQYLWSTNNN